MSMGYVSWFRNILEFPRIPAPQNTRIRTTRHPGTKGNSHNSVITTKNFYILIIKEKPKNQVGFHNRYTFFKIHMLVFYIFPGYTKEEEIVKITL